LTLATLAIWLAAGAAAHAATITVKLDAEPETEKSFFFTAGGGLTPTSFGLKENVSGAGAARRTFSAPAGSGYSLSEDVPPGWTMTSSCSDGSPVSNISVTTTETVTCTFVNELQAAGRLTLRLDTVPDDEGRFLFRVQGPAGYGGILLQDDGDPNDGPGLLPEHTVTVEAGSYVVSLRDRDRADFFERPATCDDGSAIGDVTVSVGEHVTCTLTYERPSSEIVVVQDTQPNSPQDFTFTTGGGLTPASFTLDDDSGASGSEMYSFQQTLLAFPGSGYSVTQSPALGWYLSSATCSDGSPPSNIDLGTGERVVCTFVDRPSGHINLAVDSQPNSSQPFSFTAGGGLQPASFTHSETAGTKPFSSLPPGSGYSLSQAVEPGWDLLSATCSDGSPVDDITVSEGETITCTFTNRLQTAGKLTIRVDAIPDDATRFLFRLLGPTRYNGILLQDNGDPSDGINNQHTVSVLPGSGYNLFLQQRDPGNWSQRSADCSDGSPVTNIDIAPNEEVTCTFTYDLPTSQITVVEDSVPDSTQAFAFTFREPGLSDQQFALDDDGNDANARAHSRTFFVRARPGYSIEATPVSGWDATSATCSDGSPTSDIDVSVDEHITCTFTNRQQGRINVQMDTTPRSSQSFQFNLGGAFSPGGFSLVDNTPEPSPGVSRSLIGITPGSGYSITEGAVSGWDTSATCDNGSPVTNISVAPGETVTCKWINRLQTAGRLTVRLDAVPDDFTRFVFRLDGGPTSFGGIVLQDNGNPSDGINNFHTISVEAGTGYNLFLAQRDAGNWTETSATCSDGSPVTNISISPSEEVTCTFAYQRDP